MSKSVLMGRGFAGATALSLAIIVVAGCAQNQPQNPPAPVATTTVNNPPAPTTTAASPPAGVPAPEPATNNVNAGPGGPTGASALVAQEVNKAIHTNVQLTGSRIIAVVDGNGVATLTGTAQDQQQKALAARAASDTSGVSSVKNKIEIVPTGGAKPVATKIIHETHVIIVHEPPASATAGAQSPSSGTAGSANQGAYPGNGNGTNGTSTTTNGDTSTPTQPNGNGQ